MHSKTTFNKYADLRDILDSVKKIKDNTDFKKGIHKALGKAAVGVMAYGGIKGLGAAHKGVKNYFKDKYVFDKLKQDSDLDDIPEGDINKYTDILNSVAPKLTDNYNITKTMVRKFHDLGYDLSTLRELANINKSMSDVEGKKDSIKI
jgi:hypothetical protein